MESADTIYIFVLIVMTIAIMLGRDGSENDREI